MNATVMNTTIAIAIMMMVSLAVSSLVYPLVLRFAMKHDIVDNPNARKLQREPVPVMGGVAVYAGILAGGLVLRYFVNIPLVNWGLIAMAIMLLIGVWDDMKDISATFRFIIELLLIGAFIWLTGVYIDDFHGLWGINKLQPWLGIPLSIVAGVGVINAVNLIDGVDGYSSGYGMMACLLFSLFFWNVWSTVMVGLAMIVFSALLPFFFHNVFGKKSKMFIGDGGTLMLGMVMTVFMFYTSWSGSRCDRMEEMGFSLTGFIIAVGVIPLFDTLRVMLMRILRGTSPFHADKTHLHHLFIDMGFSHLGAAVSILTINLLVVVAWYIMWRLHLSVSVQTTVVILLGILVTFGFYRFMKYQQVCGPTDEEGYPQGSAIWNAFCKIGAMSHAEKGFIWRSLTKLADSKFFLYKQ